MYEIAVISRTIFKYLFSLPVRFVIQPLSFIDKAIMIFVGTCSVSFIVFEVSFVDAVCIIHLSLTTNITFVPFAIILCFIRPSLRSCAMFYPNLNSFFVNNLFHRTTVFGIIFTNEITNILQMHFFLITRLFVVYF